jgi:hypothetical protein
VGVTTAKVIMGSIHLHFPRLKLLEEHCPVGNGVAPALSWLFNQTLSQSEQSDCLTALLDAPHFASPQFATMFNVTVCATVTSTLVKFVICSCEHIIPGRCDAQWSAALRPSLCDSPSINCI